MTGKKLAVVGVFGLLSVVWLEYLFFPMMAWSPKYPRIVDGKIPASLIKFDHHRFEEMRPGATACASDYDVVATLGGDLYLRMGEIVPVDGNQCIPIERTAEGWTAWVSRYDTSNLFRGKFSTWTEPPPRMFYQRLDVK